ncbi:hypothetical protein CPB84DRAFT_1692159 [Gymnopilus junonius]|uniref:Uncharacterized protein n=1 Tax=Gymnopilus junonius TaxID=109634 RepID=A0A9P5N9N8_GYMJU|nr:hypothetical protein CPB84DRAFT_1692159 [Gymnopilus junonius]
MDERDSQAGQQEVILTIQGIIAKKDLPPFEEKISPSSAHIQFLQQSITLIGLDMPMFQRAVDNILKIHAMLGCSIGHNNLEQCSMIGSFDNQASIEMSNQYFTPQKHAGQSQELEIPSYIDPKGYLKNAMGKHHVHIEDNIVHYYELTTDRFGESRFVPTKPIKFQVGDIAEVQVSVILVPLREKKFKSTIVLRSMSLMDGSFTQVRDFHDEVTLN